MILAVGSVVPWLRWPVAASLWIQATGTGLLGASGAVVLMTGRSVGHAFTSSLDLALGIDPLSGAFLAILALVAVPAAIFASAYLRGVPRSASIAGLTGLFQMALAGVLVARGPILFLGFWELMTLVPAAAILVGNSEASSRRAAFQYLAMTHLGGVGVWIAVLLLADYGAIGSPGGLSDAGAGVGSLVAVASIIGFGTKAGLVPLHVWLPRAHPVAPSHVSAVMSGVMIKVALYGLVRVLFEWLGNPPLWVGITLLAFGAVSALGGVVYALFQHELKRLLAFHSIENVGIIALGLGAAVVLLDRGEQTFAALALGAALLHTANHAIFKALLFLGAGAFQSAAGTSGLDRMGGLLRRMPATGLAFGVGAAAIAGVPPLNGFASEWLTLQSLLAVGRVDATEVAIAGALALAALAATAALAVLCFAKVTGLVLLGPPRSPGAADATEVAAPMRGAMATLAGLCVLLGLLPGLVLPSLAATAPWPTGDIPTQAGLAVPGTSLPTLGVGIALAAVVTLLVRLRGRSAARAPVWTCGQRVEAPLLWTSGGFTKTLLLCLEPALRPQRSLTVEVESGIVQSVTHATHIPHRFESMLYQPLTRAALRIAGQVRRIQSGDLRAYVGYLVGLIVLLLVLARTGALG